MFDSIGELPLHPLVIHAVVMLIPITFGLAVLFTYPRTRAWARWPLPLAAVGALGATLVAKESGQALWTALGIEPGAEPIGPILVQHAQLANQLVILVSVTAVLAVASALLVTRRGADRGEPTNARRAVSIALPVALIVVAALSSFWAYRVGDLGARAVWNPAGTMSYSVDGQ